MSKTMTKPVKTGGGKDKNGKGGKSGKC